MLVARSVLAALRTRLPASWRDPYRVLSWLGLALLIGLAIAVRHDVGVTLDEPLHMRYARRILSWFASGFVDRRVLTFGGTMSQYGGLFDFLAQLPVHFTHDAVGTRHVAAALCAISGIVASWKMAARLGGSRAGTLAAVLLSLTPCWVGHGLFNPKDIPFAAAAAWATYGMLRFAIDPELPSLALSIGTGVAIGAALGVRSGGLFLLAYPLLALLVRMLANPAAISSTLRVGLERMLWCWFVAWICMLVAWPWAQVSPLVRPWEGAWFAAHSSWPGRMLFNGSIVEAQHLPRSYLPVWFAVTLPETYLLAIGCSITVLYVRLRAGQRTFNRRILLGLGCLTFAAFAPLTLAVVTRAVVYDGQRHFLFILPPLAAMAGVALAAFFEQAQLPITWRAAALGMLLALFGLITSDMVRLHPYEYVYFNRLSGGLPGAAAQFETDYWGASYTEGLRWLNERLSNAQTGEVHIATCEHDEAVKLFMRQQPAFAKHVALVTQPAKADLVFAMTRSDCPKPEGQVVHVVERMGVPLLYVVQRRPIAPASNYAHAGRRKLEPFARGQDTLRD